MVLWEILMTVWDLHHLRRHHIVVHNVVKKSTDAVNTSWVCSHQASPLMTVCIMPESPTSFCSMPYKVAKPCKRQWFGHLGTKHERL